MDDIPTIILIAIMVGLCALIKRQSDCEWRKLEDEMRVEHRKKMERALKKFAEEMKNAK